MSLSKLMGGYNYDNPQAAAYNKYQSEAETTDEKAWTGYNDSPNNTEASDDDFYEPLPTESDPADQAQLTSDEIYQNYGYDPEAMDVGEESFSNENSFVNETTDGMELDGLESGSGTTTPPVLSVEDIKAKLSEVETLLKEMKKDLPKSLEKKLKDELKKLEKMLGNEKIAAYSSDYVNTELDNMYIQIMDAASGDLKGNVEDAKDKIDELSEQVEEAKDLLDPKTYDQFIETLDKVSDDLKKDPFIAQNILDGQSPLTQLATDLETAKTTPFATNTTTKTVAGSKATYESESVDLKPNPNDEIKEHHIVATQEVIIRAFNPNDHITIDNVKPGEWKVEYKHSNGEIETIIITQGSEMPVIKLDASASQITDNSHTNVAVGLLGTVQEPINHHISGLIKDMQSNETGFLNNVYKIYPEFDLDSDGKVSSNELNKAVEDGSFPPKKPDQKLFQLLVACDQNLRSKLSQFNKTRQDGDPSDKQYGAIRDHVVALLQTVYNGKDITIESRGYSDGYYTDDIIIDGTAYDIIDQDAYSQIKSDKDLYKYFVL